MGAYILWDGGSFHFDCVIDEPVSGSATPTRDPVEQGADVTDHVRDEPNRVRIEGFVSGEPLADVNGYGAQLVTRESNGLKTQVLEFPNGTDLVRDAYRALEQLKSSATLVDVATHARYFASMVITGIESHPKGPKSATISLTFESIRIVTTGKTQAPTPTQPRDQPQKSTGAQQPKDAKDGARFARRAQKDRMKSGAAGILDAFTGGS